MDAQDSIAAGVLVDLRAQADVNSTIAEAILGTLGGDVVDQIFRNEIISKELKLEMSALEVAFGIFSRGTAMAMIAENAYVPGGNFDQNRRVIEVINEHRLVDKDGNLNPSPAAAAINRALQQTRTGQVSINWGMVGPPFPTRVHLQPTGALCRWPMNWMRKARRCASTLSPRPVERMWNRRKKSMNQQLSRPSARTWGATLSRRQGEQ